MTGGYSSSVGFHSSTEQLVKDGGGSWTIKENSLPARMWGLRTITLDNQIFTTGKAIIFNKILFIMKPFILFSGGYDVDSGVYSDKIMVWDQETATFKEIGKLEQRRRFHSVSLVDINDFTCS